MIRHLPKAVLTAGLAAAACMSFSIAAPRMAEAGPINRACLKLPQASARPQLCGCIQQVADMTMSRRDQRMAAKILKAPDKAQEVKMSRKASDDAFWDRYTAFGDTAQAMCS